MKLKWRPQVLAAIGGIAVIAGLVIVLVPEETSKVAMGAITGIGMLGMKLLEGE